MQSEPTTTLQEQLEAFFAFAEAPVALWHDPKGAFAEALAGLVLPDDVTLVRDDGPRFDLKRLVNEMPADERLLVYRRRWQGLVSSDWIADTELWAEEFCPSADAAFSVEPIAAESSAETTEPEAAASPSMVPPSEQAPHAMRRVSTLTDAWYPLATFLQLAREETGAGQETQDRQDPQAGQDQTAPNGTATQATPQDRAPARDLGYRLYADCAVRKDAGTLTEYLDGLFAAELVQRASLPKGLTETLSFRTYFDTRQKRSDLLEYDRDTFVTRAGMDELGIKPSDLTAFAQQAAEATADALPYLTLPWLRSSAAAADIPLLRYELPDAFYESALYARPDVMRRCQLCGRRLFAARGAPARGRDFIASVVRQDASIQLDDLAEILDEDYGIPITRGQLLQLARTAGLHYSPELDRMFIDKAQFIREVE